MTPAPAESRRWPRWWIGIILVLAIQAGLIFLLNKESAATPSKSTPPPAFRFLADNAAAALPVNDPTLFALPHQEGFSGDAWLKIQQLTNHPPEWLAERRWLNPPTNEFGAGLAELVQSSAPLRFPLIAMPEPEPVFPTIAPVEPLSTPSRFWIEGDLAKRRLISGFSQADLRAWTNTDLLTNSTVQVLVDAHGNTLSAVLLRPRSGSDEADKLARHLAQSARFEPLEKPAANTIGAAPMPVTLGLMVFHWQVLPVPPTNAPAAAPQ